MDDRLLYIHIPFCDSKCPYCAFNSYTDKTELKKSYLDALLRDIQNEIAAYKIQNFETVYIGGGTPSVMDTAFYEGLFETLSPYLAHAKEITFEANPNSFGTSLAASLKSFGVGRLSFGAQSFNENKLQTLGRIHTKTQAIKAVELAHKTGFEKISLDLIYGVSGDSDTLLKNDIDQAVALDISHISAYTLTIEPNTPFDKKPKIATDSAASARFVASQLEAHGFTHYEVSNYGKKTSLHNTGYWQQKPYIGVGAGAVGFDGQKRYTKDLDLEDYIKNPLYRTEECLSDEELRFERLFMGLRSFIGIAQEDIRSRERLDILLNEKKLFTRSGRIYNPDFFLADELVLFLEK